MSAAPVIRPQGYWRVPEILGEKHGSLVGQFEILYSELVRFNTSAGLIPKRSSELDADITQILDGIFGSEIILGATKAVEIFDIGSGNGIPGLILALMAPERKVILVESDDKKIEFLKFVTTRLQLKNVKLARGKLENLPENSVSCAVSRGYMNLSRSLLQSRKIVRMQGEYFQFKGNGWIGEIAEIPSQICSFWAPKLVAEYELPILVSRMAIVVAKRIG